MFNTQRIEARVINPKYDGKEETQEGESKSAKVELILKSKVEGELLEELERFYFPEIKEYSALTEGQERHYKTQMTLKEFDLHLQIFGLGSDDLLLEHHGAALKAPTVLLSKKGEAWLLLRVELIWRDSLDILKSIDEKLVEYNLQKSQGDMFSEALATAIVEAHGATDYEIYLDYMVQPGLLSLIDDDLADGETREDVFQELVLELRSDEGLGPDAAVRKIMIQDYNRLMIVDELPEGTTVLEVVEVSVDSLESIEPLSEADPEEEIKSEYPLTKAQVSSEFSTFPSSQKAKKAEAQFSESELSAFHQLAAEIAFERSGKPGTKVKVSIGDLKDAELSFPFLI